MSSMAVIGVLGAGQMGGGIAHLAALHGHSVRLADVDGQRARAGKDQIARRLAKSVEKGKMTASAREEILGRIEPVTGTAELGGAAVVIEAATENLALKKSLMADLDRHCDPSAILATNTSSISITVLGAQTRRPERVIGMHFMNPVVVMQLVEIIRGLPTSDATYETVKGLAEAWGKTTVLSRDSPGFIVNRILIPLINEACFALQEGLGTAQDIDIGISLGLNHPMGPLALADLIGLDTCLAIAEVLHRELGEDKYRPANVLKMHVAAGWLGKKAGRGFYDYTENT